MKNGQTFNPNAVYAFTFSIYFGKHSMNGSNFRPSLEDCKASMLEEVIRLTQDGTPVTDVKIEAHCSACDGRGFNSVKVGKRVRKTVKKRCPVCKGKFSSFKIV